MPGTRKLWEGYLILSLFTENCRAMRDYANIESTVYHCKTGDIDALSLA